jgi:hypothetical protein
LIQVLLVGCGSTGGRGSSGDRPWSNREASSLSVVPIVAEGIGSSAHEARQDAFLRAAEEAVGAFVFAETSLSEEEIREEIVNLSAGIIEDYELLRTGQLSDGSYSVKILAHVNTQPLTSKLMSEADVSHGEVQGRALVREALTRKHSRERFATQAKKALTEVLKGFPEDYLVLKEGE